MNHTIQQRRAILDGLRQRASMATAEFYQKTGIAAEALPPRFTVVPHGNKLFGIIDRQTGTERAEVIGHMSACQSAQKFEDAARFTRGTHQAVANVARWMTRWTMVLCVLLIAFAFIGAHR